MKIIYYPEDDHVVVKDDSGKLSGIRGPSADRFLQRMILSGHAIEISHINRGSRPLSRGNLYYKN